jgi:hypothetical protein
MPGPLDTEEVAQAVVEEVEQVVVGETEQVVVEEVEQAAIEDPPPGLGGVLLPEFVMFRIGDIILIFRSLSGVFTFDTVTVTFDTVYVWMGFSISYDLNCNS